MGTKIKKLKYPVWLEIIFYILTVVAPIVLLVVQGLRSHYTVFRISFTFCCTLLLSWILFKKFILNKYIYKIQTEKVALEHDYSIDVGNSKKSRYLWFSNELKLVIGNMIDIGLFCSIAILIAVGIKNMTFNVKGSSFMVIIFYMLAFMTKVIYLLANRGNLESPNNNQ